MRLRLKDTINAWFEWEPDGETPFTDGEEVKASAIRDCLCGNPISEDKVFRALDTGDRNEGLDMIWIARRCAGRVVYE